MTNEDKIEHIHSETSFNRGYIKKHLELTNWDLDKAKLSISEELNQRFKDKPRPVREKSHNKDILNEVYHKLIVVSFDIDENVEHTTLKESLNEILQLIEKHNDR